MKKEEYFPIGTVVLLKNAKKRIMIIGYAIKADDKKIYDYLACPYPEGLIKPDYNLVFNEEQIEEVYYIGYNDKEWKKISPKIKQIAEEMKKNG